jgi:hypothetical protein
MKRPPPRPNSGLELLRPDGQIVHLGSAFDQVFSYDTEDGWQYHWSVSEARKRAEATGVLAEISLSETGMTRELIRSLYPDLDERRALTRDLTQPLLFLPFYGQHVLIDGWHRTYKALLTGVDVLPCYLLSERDRDACLIIALPPGQTLSLR